MTGRIASTFARLRQERRAALIPYLMVGYPSLQATRQLVDLLSQQGADLIELGVPFSDPLADGATIQRASHVALENGVSLADCLAVAAEFRNNRAPTSDVPIIFMSYYNPIYKYGLDQFVADCAVAGVDGLIIPDLPPEEAHDLKAACKRSGVELIFLIAPSSIDERIKKVVEMADGFIYCVSLTGVTGARSQLDENAAHLVERVRKYTSLPLVVGFGISAPEHVADVARFADGVVVGSALINLIERLSEDRLAEGVSEYIHSMKEAAGRSVNVQI